MILNLTENLRSELKAPLGRLVLETDSEQQEIIKKTYANSIIITVGDATTEKLLKIGLVPFLQIIDGQEKRVKREIIPSESILTELSCKKWLCKIYIISYLNIDITLILK